MADRLVAKRFFNKQQTLLEGQRLKDAGLVEDFWILYLPYAAEVERFSSPAQAKTAMAQSEETYLQGSGENWRLLRGAFVSPDAAL